MLILNQLAALATMISDRLDLAFSDLSPRAASALLTLRNRGPIDVSTLARIVGTTQPTATRIVDGLQKRDLIERGQREGKTVLVHLTSAGKQRAKELQSVRQACVEDMLRELSASECATLADLIDKLLFAGTTGRAHARTLCRYCDHAACHGEACPINRKATQIEQSRAQ